jgi:hypothetical protein
MATNATPTISRFSATSSELAYMRKALHAATGDCAALAYPLESGLIVQTDQSRALIRELKDISCRWAKSMSEKDLFALRDQIRAVMAKLETFLADNPLNTDESQLWKVNIRTHSVPLLWFNAIHGEVTGTWFGGLVRFERRCSEYVVRPNESYVSSVRSSLNF